MTLLFQRVILLAIAYTSLLPRQVKQDKIRLGLATRAYLRLGDEDLCRSPTPTTTMPVEVYNANPTVFATGKSSRQYRQQSLWMDDDIISGDNNAEVEEIDSEEIFGTYLYTFESTWA